MESITQYLLIYSLVQSLPENKSNTHTINGHTQLHSKRVRAAGRWMNLSQTRWDAWEGERKEKWSEGVKAMTPNSDPVTPNLAYKVPSLSSWRSWPNFRSPCDLRCHISLSYFIFESESKSSTAVPSLWVLYWRSDPKWIQGTTGPAVEMVEKSNHDASIGFVLSMYVITGIDFTAVGEQSSLYCLSSSIPMWVNRFSALSQRPPPFPCSSFMIFYPPLSTGAGSLAVWWPRQPPSHLTVETKKQAKIKSFQSILRAREQTLWFPSVVTYKHSLSETIQAGIFDFLLFIRELIRVWVHLAVFISISEIQTVQAIAECKCLSVCYFPRPITRSYVVEICISGSLLWLEVMGEMDLLRGLAASEACKCPEALKLLKFCTAWKKRDACAATNSRSANSKSCTICPLSVTTKLAWPWWWWKNKRAKEEDTHKSFVFMCVQTHGEPLSHWISCHHNHRHPSGSQKLLSFAANFFLFEKELLVGTILQQQKDKHNDYDNIWWDFSFCAARGARRNYSEPSQRFYFHSFCAVKITEQLTSFWISWKCITC